MFRGLAVTIGLLAALPAVAGEMNADEARRFVIGKMFTYTCGREASPRRRKASGSVFWKRWRARKLAADYCRCSIENSPL